MTRAALIGVAAISVPYLVAAWLVLRRQRAVWWFACALLVVGLGYLVATGAADDIGRSLLARTLGKAA